MTNEVSVVFICVVIITAGSLLQWIARTAGALRGVADFLRSNGLMTVGMVLLEIWLISPLFPFGILLGIDG